MSIILGGRPTAIANPSENHREHEMTFDGMKSRLKRPDLIMWHWTGGEGSAATCYHTLLNRGLSVSFFIDRDGKIWQFADPLFWDPQDTGGQIGTRTVSIEIANYGFRRKPEHIPRRGRDRYTDTEKIHGVKIDVARFYPAQIDAVAALTKVLCRELEIPIRFPREDGELILRRMTWGEMAAFTGIVGHFHKTRKKLDPGFQLFRELEHMEIR